MPHSINNFKQQRIYLRDCVKLHSQNTSWTDTTYHIQKKNMQSIRSKSQQAGFGNAAPSKINVRIQAAKILLNL